MLKKSVKIDGHPTSISIEQEFFDALGEISDARDLLVSELIVEIDRTRRTQNLSSAIRLFVLDYYRSRAASDN